MPNDRAGITQRMAAWLSKHGVAKNHKIIIGVSGGNDSMVLAECLLRCGHSIAIAHVNYQLRGEESEGDAQHVRAWCASNGVHLHEMRAEMAGHSEGIQAEARRIRYRWFAELQTQLQSTPESPVYIATAHHADDQAETVLLHLLRSSDPMSLSGMPPVSPTQKLLRPFLDESRQELEQWAAQWKLAPREDSSNGKSDYLRNRLRHEVLPLLESLRPGAARHLARTAERFQPLAESSRQAVDDALNRCGLEQNGAFELNLKAWSAEPLRLEILHRLSRRFNVSAKATQEISVLTHDGIESGARFQSSTCTVIRDKQYLRWTSSHSPSS
jgi:tRNA(Ile)-lysidine synthase